MRKCYHQWQKVYEEDETMTPESKTIMCVDDEQVNLQLIGEVLLDQGYVVKPFKNAPAAFGTSKRIRSICCCLTS